MSNLNVEFTDIKIRTFEVGNTRNVLEGNSSVRAVCAVGLDGDYNGYKVKVLFKGDDAKSVYNFFKGKNAIKEFSTGETISVKGSIREIREKYKEIVIDDVTYIKFTQNLAIVIKDV